MTDLTKATAALKALRRLAREQAVSEYAEPRSGLRPGDTTDEEIDAAETAVLKAFAEAYAPDPRLAVLTPAMVDLLAKAMEASKEEAEANEAYMACDGDRDSPEGKRWMKAAHEREQAWDALCYGAHIGAIDAARAHARQALAAGAQAGEGVGT